MAFSSLASKVGLGMNMSLASALDAIEADRLERTTGTSFFAWPVRLVSSIRQTYHATSWSLLLTIALGALLGMYLIDALPSFFRLRWTAAPQRCDLPEGVERVMVQGSEGKLELLVSRSPSAKADANDGGDGGKKPAILFLHGGFGSAGVWLPWVRALHYPSTSASATTQQKSYSGNVYALSLRGHGASFHPGYLEMTYLTSMTTLSVDVAACVRHIIALEQQQQQLATPSASTTGKPPSSSSGSPGGPGLILAAHSNGGGLLQHMLATGKLPLKALSSPRSGIGGVVGVALIAATPPFGAAGVYWSWLWNDPWFVARVYLHLGHPRSPLASLRLVRGAFFSDAISEAEVAAFEDNMARYESLVWPSQMMFGRFVDVEDVLGKMVTGRRNVLVLAADGDRLMGVSGQRKMAREYARAVCVGKGMTAEEVEAKFVNVHDVRVEVEGEDGKKDGGSLQLNLIRGSGHHIMNDVKRDEAVGVFKKWAESV